MRTTQHTPAQLMALAFDEASEAQLQKLGKMIQMGWKVSEIVGPAIGGWKKKAIALNTKDNACWLLPDGTVVRPKDGSTVARITNAQLRKSAA